jgi:uncharacterized membrane protein HdeD (DUF308 family)
VRRRSRIIWGSIVGGLLVLAGLAFLLQWQGWAPAWCVVPVALAEALGVWLLIGTLKRNARFVREDSEQRSIVPFGLAVFLILFGVGLTLATFKLVPDIFWSLGAFLIALGGTFIYRAIVLPNSNDKDTDESENSG